MSKTILITGSTDGIGLEAARMLVSDGHHVLLHGRSKSKLEDAQQELSTLPGDGIVASYLADLSRMADVEALAAAVVQEHAKLDVLINNAGVLKTSASKTAEGLDVRFVVNTIAPYLLTQRLLPLISASGRVVNVASAAQATVDPEAFAGQRELDDYPAYAQSKLALMMWSRHMALALEEEGPAIIALNPGSLLGTKMVREGFGVAGGDIRIGGEILTRAALSDEFGAASGRYFDNDSGQFAEPHADTLDPGKTQEILRVIESVLAELTRPTG